MKRLFAILMVLALLAGCGNPGASGGAATLPEAPAAAPQRLVVADLYTPGRPNVTQTVLEAYAAAMQVEITYTDSPQGAGLVLLPAAPQAGEGYRVLTDDPLLAAAAARAENAPACALPLGRTLYAYWADSAMLGALLGDSALPDLQQASWAEWSAFVQAVDAWLAQPAATGLTLNGHPYTLPEEKPQQTQTLTGVFARSGSEPAGYTAPLLAAGSAPAAQTLEGPLNALASALLLEQSAAVRDNAQAALAFEQLRTGQALFCRAPLADLAIASADKDLWNRLAPIPFKGEYTEADLATNTYNLTGLLGYPTFAQTAWLAIPETADEDAYRAGAAALLWLYGSTAGESLLIDDVLLVSPWGTASNTDTLAAAQVQQVGRGVLPGALLTYSQITALAAAEQALWQTGDRTAFVQAAAAALTGNPAPPAPGDDGGPENPENLEDLEDLEDLGDTTPPASTASPEELENLEDLGGLEDLGD